MRVSVNWVDFEIDIDKIEKISFYYDSKRHKWIAYLDYRARDEFEISEKKGEAIIEFLKWLGQMSKKLSSPGSEETFDRALSKESSTVGPGNEETFDMVHDEEIFDSAASSKGTSAPGIEDIFAEDHSEDSFDFQIGVRA